MIQPDGSPAVSLTNAMAKAAMRHGLILRTSGYGHGNVVKIRPPLILTHAEADDICDRFAALLEEETA
jgi:4-aminobutyrate aminotransferase